MFNYSSIENKVSNSSILCNIKRKRIFVQIESPMKFSDEVLHLLSTLS